MPSKPVELRSVTCQSPVMPGFTASRCRSYSVYSATSLGSGGRGPTTDICPRNTLRNCGNSSMECLRMNFPILVTRGSSFILNMAPAISFCSLSSARRSSASLYMERNFHMRNVVRLPSGRVCPTRIWL